MGRNTTADALLGAFAGTIATFAMNRVTSALYEREGFAARVRETRARGGTNTNTIAARKAARLVGAELTDDQASRAGEAAHHAIGTGSGALYGMVRRRIPAPPPVRGLLFGAALWLVADEIGNPALGVTPGPRAFPWQAHARGLAGHLVYGLVTEGILAAADALATRENVEAVVSRAEEFAGVR